LIEVSGSETGQMVVSLGIEEGLIQKELIEDQMI